MSEQASPSPLKQRILRQRTLLYNMLVDPMQRVAHQCLHVCQDRVLLDATLLASLHQVPYCTYLYAMDPQGHQISSNAAQTGLMPEDFGRDRSHRPYMRELVPNRDMILSDAYISLRANRPSVTAVQKVHRGNELIGYIGADFDLRELPITKDLYADPGRWRQLKGDPAIRGQLFQQRRVQSRLDANIDQILPVLEELVTDNGVFHVKVHFSSSRATVWLADDPYRYQLLEFDELVDPDICLAFRHQPYPGDAVVPQESIRPILETFKQLRFADQTIYLRSGSINIFNGIVGLNFSCDGSHYVPHDLFLVPESEFWQAMG